MKKMMTIVKTEFLLFIRDFFGFFFTFVFPVLMLVLYGSIYGNEPIYPGAEVRIMDVSVPAYSIMIMGVTGLMAFPLTLAEYKEKKIYKRFDATPVGKKSIILAQVIVNVLMTLIGFGLLLTAGKILYQIQLEGTAFSVFIALVFSMSTMFSMGFLFTAVGKDTRMTNLLCYLFYFVMIFLSGATMPDSLFPDTVKKVSAVLPMTYAVDLMQGVFAGDGLVKHLKELLILGGLTTVFITLGAILYGKKDWT
ncbi:MAG: ABC transporter permease [Lachnospiraceae bacterium]